MRYFVASFKTVMEYAEVPFGVFVPNFANFEVFVFLFGLFPPRVEEPGFPTGGSRLFTHITKYG
jgi:hypothetical protein